MKMNESDKGSFWWCLWIQACDNFLLIIKNFLVLWKTLTIFVIDKQTSDFHKDSYSRFLLMVDVVDKQTKIGIWDLSHLQLPEATKTRNSFNIIFNDIPKIVHMWLWTLNHEVVEFFSNRKSFLLEWNHPWCRISLQKTIYTFYFLESNEM